MALVYAQKVGLGYNPCLEWSPCGRMLAIFVPLLGSLVIFDLKTFSKRVVFKSAYDLCAGYCIAWSPCGKRLAVGTKTGIRVLNIHDGSLAHNLMSGHCVRSIKWSPCGTLMLSATSDNWLFLHDSADNSIFCKTLSKTLGFVGPSFNWSSNRFMWSSCGTLIAARVGNLICFWNTRGEQISHLFENDRSISFFTTCNPYSRFENTNHPPRRNIGVGILIDNPAFNCGGDNNTNICRKQHPLHLFKKHMYTAELDHMELEPDRREVCPTEVFSPMSALIATYYARRDKDGVKPGLLVIRTFAMPCLSWTDRAHADFTFMPFRREVFALMLVRQYHLLNTRGKPQDKVILPMELWLHVMQFLARGL